MVPSVTYALNLFGIKMMGNIGEIDKVTIFVFVLRNNVQFYRKWCNLAG